METRFSVLFAICLMTICLALKPLIHRLHIPYVLMLVVLGYFASEAFVSLGFDTGIRADNFHAIIEHFFIPILIFSSANEYQGKVSAGDALNIACLTVCIATLTFIVTMVLIYFGIGHASGFPWQAAMLTAAVLLAVDSHAVHEFLQTKHITQKVRLAIGGEGLLCDVTSVTLFTLILAYSTMPSAQTQWLALCKHFFWFVTIGMLCGYILGKTTLFFIKHCQEIAIQGLFSVLSVYITFIIAKDLFDASGVISVFVLGLMMGNHSDELVADHYLERIWQMFAILASSAIYLLVGLTTSLGMFQERWLAMLIAICAVLIARTLGVYFSTGILVRMGRFPALSYKERNLLIYSGIRGALTLALAFSIPTTLPYWWTIQSIAFGVVLFGLVIQASYLKWHCYRM